jgi:osmotically inducible lipoprotein OsmB
MKLGRLGIVMVLALGLGACGTTPGDRAATGAIVGGTSGALIGIAFGGVGIGAGAFVGAAIGAGVAVITKPEQLNLPPGKPVWR